MSRKKCNPQRAAKRPAVEVKDLATPADPKGGGGVIQDVRSGLPQGIDDPKLRLNFEEIK